MTDTQSVPCLYMTVMQDTWSFLSGFSPEDMAAGDSRWENTVEHELPSSEVPIPLIVRL